MWPALCFSRIGNVLDVSEIDQEVRASKSEVDVAEGTTRFTDVKVGLDSTEPVTEIRAVTARGCVVTVRGTVVI